jgi:hypothetical protein
MKLVLVLITPTFSHLLTAAVPAAAVPVSRFPTEVAPVSVSLLTELTV